ncbi:hypothetical protein V5O48_011560 [Marasmius crinis-equi]|uniref:Uncharacterized protein n=1 Tax=Marasmius crinis-equi TaxID=585013 RepID=A0ABR3F5C5_9AGAR
MDEAESPQMWPTLDSMDSEDQLATLLRPSILMKGLKTPPRSRSSSTSTPPRQPRKSRYQKSSHIPISCPAETALETLMASTHISDSSPKRRNQSQCAVKSLFFVPPPPAQLLLPNRLQRPALSTFGHSDTRIQTSRKDTARNFARSNSTSQIPRHEGSDFSSNSAGAGITFKYDLGHGRGMKRMRSKSEQENEDVGKVFSEQRSSTSTLWSSSSLLTSLDGGSFRRSATYQEGQNSSLARYLGMR